MARLLSVDSEYPVTLAYTARNGGASSIISQILEILSRLTASANLSHCRVVSKTLNSLTRDIRSINLVHTLSLYQKSSSPVTVFDHLIRNARNLESVSFVVDKSLGEVLYDEVEEESDDLYLTDVGFVKDWLPRVCAALKVLSFSDFSI